MSKDLKLQTIHYFQTIPLSFWGFLVHFEQSSWASEVTHYLFELQEATKLCPKDLKLSKSLVNKNWPIMSS
jgi:hypothetical protein